MKLNRSHATAGFSVLEAIIALLVASLILSVILPIASRSVSDNLRIGMRGLDAVALSIEESADVLGISPATVKRDWTLARAWLHRELAVR